MSLIDRIPNPTLGTPTSHRIHLPDVGETLTLAEDWTFTLKDEFRNEGMWKALAIEMRPSGMRYGENQTAVTLPAGTVLKVDRVYVRKGNGYGNFSSVTFYLMDTPMALAGKPKHVPFTKKDSPKSIARFWASLSEVNHMVVEGA